MKTNRILAILMVLVLTMSAFVGCASVDEQGDVTVVVENRDGTYTVYKTYLENVENKDEGAVGVVENLAARDKAPLTIDMQDSGYGKFVKSVGSLVPDSSVGEFISVYTSVEKDFGTFEGVNELKYEGVTLKSSGVVLSSMTVTSGTVILFRIETYTF